MYGISSNLIYISISNEQYVLRIVNAVLISLTLGVGTYVSMLIIEKHKK